MATKSFSYTISSTIYENSPFKQNLRNTSSAVPSDINSINIIDIKVTATAIVTDELTLGLGFSSTNLTSYALNRDNNTATITVTSSSSSWNSLISAVKNTGDVTLYGSLTDQSNTGLTIEVVVNYTPVTSNTSDDTGVTTPRGIGSGTVPVVPGGGISSGNVPIVSGGKVGTVVSDDVFFSLHNNVLQGWETASVGIVNNGQSYEPIKFKVTITVHDLPDGYNFYYGYTEYPTDENEVTNDNDGGNFTISFDVNPSDRDWEKYYNMYTNSGQVLNLYLQSEEFNSSVDVDVSVYFKKDVVWKLTDKSVTYSTSSQTVNIDAVPGVNGIEYIVDLTNDLPPFTLNGTTLTIPAGTTAGTYNVLVIAIGFHDSEGTSITNDFNLVINKADAYIYFEPDDGWTYDGTSHSLGTVSYLGDGDLYYALTTVEGNVNKANIDAAVASYINYGGSFTKTHNGDTISTTNAGQYVFMAYSTAGINYNASYSPTSPLHYAGTFDVYKATPKFEGHNGIGKIIKDPKRGTLIPIVSGTVSASVEGTVHYGATTAMESTKHVTPDADVVVVNRNTIGTTTVYAWFEPTDKRNYNNVGSTTSGYITVSATVTAKEIPTVSFQYSTRTYNGSVQYEQFKSNVAGKLYRKADVALTSSNYTTGTMTTVAANTWTNCNQAIYPGVWHMNYYFVPNDTSTYDNVTPDPHDFVMQKADDNFTFSPEYITTTYNGNGQNVTITSATGAHGTLSYEVLGVMKKEGYSGEYLGDNPTRDWEITSGTTLHIPANSVSNAGTYYVTVRATSAESSYYNKTTKTANFYVHINKASIRPDTFTISPTSQTIYNVGKINFTIKSANSLGSVTYSSSNTSVANVSTEGNNTIVSYVGSGHCTITATDSGNSNYESATATCDVTCIKDYLDTEKYKDTSGTSGYNITAYGTPYTPNLDITNLTAAGGTIGVSGSTGTVTNNISYYQKYHYQTNLYSDLQKGTAAGTVGYKITSQEFSPNSSGSPSLGISRFSISGSTVTHTTMDTDSGYDFVYVAAYNAGNTSKVSTSVKASVQNKVESISMDFDDNVSLRHLIGAPQEYQMRYNATAEVFVDAHYTSGSKANVSNSATITSADTTIIKVK